MLNSSRMRRLGCAASIISILLSVPAAVAQPLRLEDQRVEGINRVCVYGNLGRQRTQQVGRGEPCPQTLRRTAPQEEEIVPSLATLAERRVTASQTVCVYAYLGRTYLQTRAAGGYCPYTPSAAN